LVPIKYEPGAPVEDPSQTIYRIWLDGDQVRRLKAGRYFATVVRKNESCWTRGDLSKDSIFFMDNADPPPDTTDSSAFYNKAPRISSFDGDAYICTPAK
jgi:hypothetical protein